MKKIINPLTTKDYNGKTYNIFVKIEYDNGNLSFVGVEGPMKNGNSKGGCGQIQDGLIESDKTPTEKWNSQMVNNLYRLWKTYHLNNMQSACQHQRKANITYTSNPKHVCPTCGFKIGTAWLKKEVPQHVIDYLFSLPDSEITPAWI